MAYPWLADESEYSAVFPSGVMVLDTGLEEEVPGGFEVVSEAFTVPASADADGRYRLHLDYVPFQQSGLSIEVDSEARVLIPFGEVPSAGQVAVSFRSGAVEFHSSDAGLLGEASYIGKGSAVSSYHVTKLEKELIAVQNKITADLVSGPGSSVDDTVARWDGTTGQLLAGSLMSLSDDGDVGGVRDLTMSRALYLTGATSAGTGIQLGTSCQIYEGAANTIVTPDALTVQGRLAASGATSAGAGLLLGSDGILYRSALDTIRTPGSFIVDVEVQAGTCVVGAGGLGVTGSSTFTGTATFDGSIVLGDATSDTISGSARWATDIVPSTTNARDVGSTALRLKDGWFAGAVTAGSFAGALNGTVGAVTPAAGSFTTLTASSTATFGTVDINGGAIDGTAIGASTRSTGAFTTLAANSTVTLSGATSCTNTFSATGATVSLGTNPLVTVVSLGGLTTFPNADSLTNGVSVGSAAIKVYNNGGVLTVGASVAASNLSGTNTGNVTLGTSLATNLLGLSGQELTLDTQSANLVFAGPTGGGAAAPSFRALVDGDVPATLTGKTLTGSAFNGTVGATTRSTGGFTTLGLDGALTIEPSASVPSDPSEEEEMRIFSKGGYIIFQYKEGISTRYKYLSLSGTSVTWGQGTSSPA